MKILLSDGSVFYIGNTDNRFTEINSHAYCVGSDIIYGVTEDGDLYRINPDTNPRYLEEITTSSRVIGSTYDSENDEYLPITEY